MCVRLSRVAWGIALLALLLGAVLAGLAGYRYATLSRYAEPPLLPQLATAPAPQALALTVFDPPRVVPHVRFTDADGRGRTLRDFRGRVVLVDIWATWCAPCRQEMPALDRLADKFSAADFVVLPVSIDRSGKAAVAPFYRALGIRKLGIYLDPLGRGTSALAIPGVPTTLLIDRAGGMVVRKIGEAEWDSPKLIALIRRYLAGVAASAP
jgi:thiol-disulfide isomerase/thioredoxin